MDATASKKRILILGGGFGGVATARHLERLFRRRPDVEIVLVSRDNFLLMTPLLFEVFSGTLDLRACSFPIRAFLRTTRFVEATVQGIDLDRRVVRLEPPGRVGELAYDQLVLALGSKTNREMIPGSEHAFTFKTLADALLLRNHVIERFERADVETDPRRKAQAPHVRGHRRRAGRGGAARRADRLRGRHRAPLRARGPRRGPVPPAPGRRPHHAGDRPGAGGVRRPGAGRGGAGWTCGPTPGCGPSSRARSTWRKRPSPRTRSSWRRGIVPNPVVAGLPVEKDRRGHIVVEPTLRCRSHPEVWALGDCASIPGPDGKPYPNLAQHALRQARVLAGNIAGALDGRPPRPFVYHTLGMMGSLGHGKGFGQLLKVRVHGFPAWLLRRTYYLLQMPGWGRRLRIMIDWTFALLFRPDIVKVGLDSETALLLREVALGDAAGGPQEEGGARTDSATDGSPLALVEPGVRRPKPAVIERGST